MRRVVVVVLALLAASCSAKTGGHPTAAPTRPTPHDTTLAARLEQAPPGSMPWQSTWGSTEFMSPQQMVDLTFLPDERQVVLQELIAQGCVDVVHRAWNARDADEIDIVLLRFKDEAGAEGQFLSERDVFMEGEPLSLSVPGFPQDHLASYIAPHRTRGQFVVVRTVAFVHDVAMEAFYFSPGRLLRADLDAWIGRQLTLLR